ncbi:MAG: penicillin-binding protein activator LpoB [Deltaproteobacteria bacterium]|nr:penicillin-binding protein activator LpoB [Deltaproteobacteria bacterium]
MKKMNMSFLIITVCSALLAMSGCMASTRNLNPDDEYHYDASYDFSDKKQIVDRLVNPLLSAAHLFPAQVKPVLIVYPVVNETSEHISTSGITDEIRMKLLNSGKVRFINEHQRENIMREVSYQNQGFVDPAQRVEQGRQLGADYILSGTLRSIKKKQPEQWRIYKKERIYYSLDLTMTDLKTGEIVYADQAELAREASKPIIGW